MANASNVRVGTSGAIYVGPTSATAPTSATSNLVGFTDYGWIHSDGVTATIDKSTNQIRAWQDSSLLREIVTEATATFQFVLLETSREAVELYYGSPVDVTDGSVEVNPAATGGRKSFVIDVIDGDSAVRTYVPSGEVLSVGDQVYQNGEPIGYDVTLTAYVGADGYSFKKFYSALVD